MIIPVHSLRILIGENVSIEAFLFIMWMYQSLEWYKSFNQELCGDCLPVGTLFELVLIVLGLVVAFSDLLDCT